MTPLDHTVVTALPLLPGIRLHLITEACPLWRASEAEAAALGLIEPYWAFCWPGGQALARYVLDNPRVVAGKRVLDFGSGCAVEAIAALQAGARSVLCADLDPLASAAAHANAALNGVALETTERNLMGQTLPGIDLILAGDVFYDRDLAATALSWLRTLDAEVLIGDPSRGFLDATTLHPIATYDTTSDGDTTGTILKRTTVFALKSAFK